jgi:hypothetical protein
MACLQRRGDAFRRGECEGVEIGPLQRPGPGIEYLHDLGAGLDLGRQIGDGRVGQPVDQRRKGRGIGRLQRVRGPLVGGAAAGDHVGRDRPGRAGKSDQRGLGGQFAPQDAQGFIDRREMLVNGIGGLQRRRGRGGLDGVEPRPLAGGEPQPRPQRLGQEQDVGKQDRRVKAIAADRLQG